MAASKWKSLDSATPKGAPRAILVRRGGSLDLQHLRITETDKISAVRLMGYTEWAEVPK